MLRSLLKEVLSRHTAPTDKPNVLEPTSIAHDEWLDSLIVRMFQLMHVQEQDNFDADRYRGTSPSAFFYTQHAAYLSFVLKNAAQFFAARSLLSDETSQALFDQIILFRALSHLHVRMPVDGDAIRAYVKAAESWKVGESEEAGILGSLSQFSVPTQDAPIRVKCWRENIAATFLLNQYYFIRDGAKIAVASGDYVIDAGGCFGDTALRFTREVGANGHVFTFDPLGKHCEIMRDNFKGNPDLESRVSIFPYGLSDHENDVTAAPSSGVIDPGARITDDAFPLRSIDRLVADGIVSKIDFIKMDVEGSELAALAGAEMSLKKWRPRLAISLYHRPEDLFSIPLWLNSIECGYRFYLDHYSIHHEETVLYALADG